MIHIEAEQVIEDLNRGVVLANNILESANGIHMIDCELRRIGIMSPQDIAHWLNTFATRMILNKRSKYIQTVNMN